MKIASLGFVAATLMISAPALAGNTPWHGYGGDAQHSANAPAPGQALAKVHWSMPVDLSPPFFLGIHYASPMITAGNTLLVPVRTTSADTFRIEARNPSDGSTLWQMSSDYVLPAHDWIPSFPAHLTEQNRLYIAGIGGTVLFRDDPDSSTGNTGKLVFFGKKNYNADRQAYDQRVMISTPITADSQGNIYFGFVANPGTPIGLKSGIARISASGKGIWISAADAAQDQNIGEVAKNCGPAVSLDEKTIYIAVRDSNAQGYLLGLDSTTLAPKYRARLIDPNSHTPALISGNSSASPTIGPDGDVYYGVIEFDGFSHNDRGWLLHFNSKLTREKTPGSFGWDNTASVVPASAVPSYTGASTYLLMSKYNNYFGIGSGDGHNKIAILDPHAKQNDPIIGSVKVMKEILTKVGPTQEPGEPEGVVYEWCINSAVVDVANKAVIVNSEDGHTYRWDLTTNKLKPDLFLNEPTFEAYTPTLIGPDGTIYSINDAKLYAIGN